MGDVINTLSITGIESKLRSLSGDISSLSSQVSRMDKSLSSEMKSLREDLDKLNVDFKRMMEDQKKANSMQQAVTELVRVRQEINQRYNNYSVVRETMIGVLQATDVALVKKETISRVSEELMLSTPSYWLAPCLVAVAAWISNDRDLADRAIREAIKRDEEKTALAMALICRRNNRIDTCYEWLSIYFSKQKATSITEETFTYIDAYVNGIFGPDRKHVCSGYISKWIDEIRGNRSDFEASQEKKWAEYCETFKVINNNPYPDLNNAVRESKAINDSLATIQSFPKIHDVFRGINEAYIDEEVLKATIDEKLIQLISNYDKIEISIRREEEYLTLVKAYNGDEERAKGEMVVREAQRQQKKLDFIEQMSNEITTSKSAVPSKRKTAVTFLSNYINRGYEQYVTSSLINFPSEVNVTVDQWSGKSTDGSEFVELSMDYEKTMDELRQKELSRAMVSDSKPKKIGGFVSLGLAAISLFLPALLGTTAYIVAAVCAIVGVCLLSSSKRSAESIQKKVDSINSDYDTKIANGKNKLHIILEQWAQAKREVSAYKDEGEHKVVA